MEALADAEQERKRQEKLQRARAKLSWREEWLTFNDNADAAATRARRRHPVPAEAAATIRRVDAFARQALWAAVEAVEAAAPPSRRRS